ncbi:MAG: hypothetical protein WCC10_17450 [Tumebacillaceae bacterium]
MKREGVRVQADESMKALFNLSKRPTLDLLNGLFGEHFTLEEAEIIRKNTEFVPADMNVIVADWIIQVTQGGQARQFHVEFQTYDQSSMVVRMFEYGFQIAKEAAAKEANLLILRYPQQLVLYLERDDSIAEEISCIVEFPPYEEQNKFEYKVPVKKFWNISVEELKDSLYALIPFHVFTARKQIADIEKDRGLSEDRKRQLIHRELSKVKGLLESSRNYLLEIHRAGKITDEDLDQMSTVMINLSHYLYRKFIAYYETFLVEVETMVTHVLNFEAMNNSRLEGLRQGVEEGRQAGLEEGRQEGLEEGRQEGWLEARTEVLLSILEAKGGVKDENLTAIINQQTDIAKLTEWVVLASTKPIESVLSEIYKERA